MSYIIFNFVLNLYTFYFIYITYYELNMQWVNPDYKCLKYNSILRISIKGIFEFSN